MGASTKGKSDPHARFSPGEGKGGNETGKGMEWTIEVSRVLK